MDPLHLCIALGPVIAYLMLLGLINSRRRPFLTTGARDLSALGIGVSGLVIAGPMELFLPELATNQFGAYVWVMMLALYGLCWTLIVLLVRPRLVIYNMTVKQLRPILSAVASDLDPELRWAGDSLSLPSLHVQLHLETFTTLRCTQLVSSGSEQSCAGWRKLEIKLAEALKTTESSFNPYAMSLIFLAVFMAITVTFKMATNLELVQNQLREMLRL